MTNSDFWRNSKVAVIGGGSWGTVLANLLSENCLEVRLWLRDSELARAINATKTNERYLPGYRLSHKISAYSEISRVLDGDVNAVVLALPSSACRHEARNMAALLGGHEFIFHATKGVEADTLKRMSEVLSEELPCRRIGVISGPNLAQEIARGEPAATVVASGFDEVLDAGQALFGSALFRIYRSCDMIGVEWAGTLKNILAIASGALDAMKFGWNSRAMLITRGLAEIVRFGVAMGAKEGTFLGLAGLGDMLATCGSPLSRNYRVGMRMAKGDRLSDIIKDLGGTAEGIMTTRTVWRYSKARGISMPITESVFQLLEENVSVKEAIQILMTRPSGSE
ncbi:MAG: NAD(P)H-dependent glycerol-3-phosphate dehydrogenase [Bdellovibrionota bacterium]